MGRLVLMETRFVVARFFFRSQKKYFLRRDKNFAAELFFDSSQKKKLPGNTKFLVRFFSELQRKNICVRKHNSVQFLLYRALMFQFSIDLHNPLQSGFAWLYFLFMSCFKVMGLRVSIRHSMTLRTYVGSSFAGLSQELGRNSRSSWSGNAAGDFC